MLTVTSPATNTTLIVNGPTSHACQQCGRALPLRQTFRAEAAYGDPETGEDCEQIGASWECLDCLKLPDELTRRYNQDELRRIHASGQLGDLVDSTLPDDEFYVALDFLAKPRIEIAGIVPGPWRVAPDPELQGRHPFHDTRFVLSGVGEQEIIVCKLMDDHRQAATANLIARAPALQQALVACLRALKDISETIDAGEDKPSAFRCEIEQAEAALAD